MSFHLGLTGSIATGKSTVSKYFKEKGFPIVDADKGARIVVEPGQPGLKAIIDCFGPEFFFPNQTLNRKKLGDLIFHDEAARQRLNQILAPHIRKWIQDETAKYEKAGHELIVLDIPLLHESEYEYMCDEIMVVYTPETVQLARLMARDNLSEQDAIKRITSQMNITRKADRADIVIDNSGTVLETYQQIYAWLAVRGFQTLL